MHNLPAEDYNNKNCISQLCLLMIFRFGCITVQYELNMLREIWFYFIIYSNSYYNKTYKIRFHYNLL